MNYLDISSSASWKKAFRINVPYLKISSGTFPIRAVTEQFEYVYKTK